MARSYSKQIRSLRSLNPNLFDAWLASYGTTYPDEERFWQAISGISSPSSYNLTDNMKYALQKWGYSKLSIGDNLREWMQDLIGQTTMSLNDNAQLFFTNMGGLTFMKRFDRNQSSVNANFSIGSPVGTFTATRGASNPATYISDSSGTVSTTTASNAPRFTQGFYNSTGFVSRPGLIIEGASTNLVPKSQIFNDATWTASNITVTDNQLTSPDGTTNAASLTATGANGTLLLASAVTGATFSVWLRRKTGTGNIDITANGGTNYTTVTLVAGQWARFSVSAASASQTAGIRIVTSGDEVYAWGAQFENLAFATTYIPTTAGALTRNTEILSYIILGNRTAATESVFVKFTTFWNAADPTANLRLFSADNPDRNIRFDAASDKFLFAPNATDSSTAGANELAATTTSFTSKVLTGIAISSTGNPNTALYTDSVSQAGGNPNTDWTVPTFGTNFYIGNTSAGTVGLYGIIESTAIYSNAKSSANVSKINGIMNA